MLAQMHAGGVFRKRSEKKQNQEEKIADLQVRRIDQDSKVVVVQFL
jgi:hypothetical protein